MNANVEAAKAAYENAARSLVETVTREYPVGTVMTVQLGGHELRVRVVRHSESWWYNPGEIVGENIRTGKIRRFHASDIVTEPLGCADGGIMDGTNRTTSGRIGMP